MLPILALLAGSSVADAGTPPPALVEADGTVIPNVAGRVLLFVNVASKCGYTPQYEGLQALYSKYKDQGLLVVGAPCNQFGGQEPGSKEEIASFCQIHYGVDFPILDKADVNGPGRSPLYQWLLANEPGGGKPIKWNFEKFLVDRSGAVTHRFGSGIAPQDPGLVAAIEAALAAPAVGRPAP